MNINLRQDAPDQTDKVDVNELSEAIEQFKSVGAQKYGEITVMLPAKAQMIFSPGPLIFQIRDKLKNFTTDDYLLLSGDPAIIGVTCSIVSDMTNGKYKLLKWDRQEKTYYPIEINIFQN